MGITVVYDAIRVNAGTIPHGAQAAGYVTGSGDIPWGSAEFAAHPGAIRIDQSPMASVWDATADVDDYEAGAVALSDLAPRAKLRIAAFKNATRPGQREPLVYMSANNVTAVANALVSGGVVSGVGLWVANWNLTEPEAVAQVLAASGPFPIRGVQFASGQTFDMSVFDSTWLATVSGKPNPGTVLPAPPGRWERGVVLAGIGTDGNVWTTRYVENHGWTAPQKVT